MSTLNSATMNIGVHVFLNYFFFFLSICPGVEWLGHDSSIFSFIRNLQLLSIVAVLIYIPTNNVGGFSFFFSILTPSLQQTGIACSHSRTWAECGHCGKRHQWVRVFTPPPPAGPLLPLLRAVQIDGSTRNKATVTVTRSLTHSFSIYWVPTRFNLGAKCIISVWPKGRVLRVTQQAWDGSWWIAWVEPSEGR